MKDNEFRAWLTARNIAGSLTEKSINNRISRVRRVERALGDLDRAYAADQLEGVLQQLVYTEADASTGQRPLPALVPRSENPVGQMRAMRNAVRNYRQFLEATEDGARASEWPELDALRLIFLDRCPDFENFQERSGKYYKRERRSKDGLLDKISSSISEIAITSRAKVGKDILKILGSGPGSPVHRFTKDDIEKNDPLILDLIYESIADVATNTNRIDM